MSQPFINLVPLRQQRLEAARRKFTLRHFTRAEAAVLGFAGGCAFCIILAALLSLLTVANGNPPAQ